MLVDVGVCDSIQAQDTNVLQLGIAQKMAHRGNMMVVGDPDQTIYT